MVANEVYSEPHNHRSDQWQQDYDEEDALSLCDLPIYSGSFESSNDHFSPSKEDYQSSSDDQDFFEFFSADFSTVSSTCTSSDNIIFCGKLIPCKNPAEATHKLHQINTTQQLIPKKKLSFLQWRSKSLNKPKTSKDNTAKHQINSNNNNKNNNFEHQKISGSKTLALPTSNKCSANNKYGYSVKKVSILTSPTKPRWHLFLFGLARFPTEMELSDMRSRQHRRTPSSSTLFSSFDEANEGKDVKGGRTTRGKGLWRLLSVLGCRNSHANTVVKASCGCIPCV